MSFHLHRAERTDRLVAALADVLRTPLDDPFAPEIVSVPTRGVERWLSQQLSERLGTSPDGRDGVCAGVRFPSPRRLVAEAVEGTGEQPAGADPWQPERAVWPLLRVIDGCRGEAWAAVLWSYLGDSQLVNSQLGNSRPGDSRLGADPAEPLKPAADPVRSGRRWSTARHLAGLFAGYAAYRPTMISHWLAGRDTDVHGRELPTDRAWQAELWRRLRAEIDLPSPAERLAGAIATLTVSPDASSLPMRLSLFGATRLDPQHLLVLMALAAERDVHLWLPHPSPKLWDAVRARLQEQSTCLGPRAEDHTAELASHRLLAYLGRDSRELQICLAAPSGADLTVTDQHYSAPPRSRSLLGALQADIAANRFPRPEFERPVFDRTDRSVAFHASHGPDRQVEVLRELLVGLLADDDTLEPRDIVVMCPDIETFAPLIAAAFGLDTADTEAEHPGHRLRVRLADRSLRQVNPLLATVSRLVSLAESRMESTALLDLCATPAVARKFGFSAEHLLRLRELVPSSGVRWGLDAEHRRRYGMADFRQNTWAAGLDRLLLGVTMDEAGQHFIGTALPLDDVDSGDVDLVGRLAEFVERVRGVTDACLVRQPLSSWVRLFKDALMALTAVLPSEAWQLTHAYAELGSLTEQAADDDEVALSLPEISALLAEAFRGRASRANFRTGTLTMCTMLPMRSIPHRVVCLLGVDDGVFPRHQAVDGDDLLAVEEWVGDRNARSEDRQLLLDAILSAQDHLMVVYSGMDPRTGAGRPPAVPIGELLDALDLTARTVDGGRVRDQITVTHPLQPFDLSNFVPGELTRFDPPGTSRTADEAGPFSFDRAAMRGARATVGARSASAPVFDPAPLDPLPDEGHVELADLTRFFGHPVKALLKDRAALSVWRDEERAADQLPVDLDGLEQWAIGDRLLKAHLDGGDLGRLAAAEWRRGELPPQGFGSRVLNVVTERVAQLAASARPFLTGPRERREVTVRLGDQVLTGTVANVVGEALVRVNYGWLSAKHRLDAWLDLLATTAADPGTAWRAVVIAYHGSLVLGPVDGGVAVKVLADLLDLRRTGLLAPLPFAPKTSAEYAKIRFENHDVEPRHKFLTRTWEQEHDEAYGYFFGPTLADLMAQPSVAAEERGSLRESSRFGTLARRVFHPMLCVESSL